MRLGVGVAVAGVVAFSLSACSISTELGDAQVEKPVVPQEPQSSPEVSDDYFDQVIDWQECGADQVVAPLMPEPDDLDKYQCAIISAPTNWDDLEGSSPIDLGIARYVGAGGPEAPVLFFNLGGPGGEAVRSLSGVVGNILTEPVVDHFQIVAVDPRGVGSSTPIWCMTDEERDADIAKVRDTSDLSTQELVQLANEETQALGAQCLERNGELLGYVDSYSAAKDFDLVRQLMGQETFDYIGFSYGTVLGANYAELFPTTVGRMVLDGAVDPGLSINELSAAQIEGMENSLYHWIELCQSGVGCPLEGGVEQGKEQMIHFLDSVRAQPLETSDPERPLNINLAYTAIIGSLYSTETYPLLTQGVSQAFKGDGTTLLFLADYFNSRGVDGEFTDNSSDAFVAVNALDYAPVGTEEEWQAQADDLAQRFPVLASDFGFASAGLDQWPVTAKVQRHKVTAPGTPEILVIGTTNDPATPMFMAENLAADLEGGVLITVEGWDHTAYRRSASDCVRIAVDAFLINGVVPEAGLVCNG